MGRLRANGNRRGVICGERDRGLGCGLSPPTNGLAVPGVVTAEAVDIEQEYRAHRDAVMAMLRTDFRGVGEREELYQEAWPGVLERQAAGEDIRNLRALLKLVAWRRARDVLRNRSAAPTDPSGWLLESQRDPGPAPEEQADVRLDAARIRRVVETLDERHAAVIKLRFDSDSAPRRSSRSSE